MLDYIHRKKIDEYKRRCKVLELSYDSDVSEFKASFKRLLKIYHPDISKEKDSKIKTQEILDAYEGIYDLRNEVIDILAKQKIKKQVKNIKPFFVRDYDNLVGFKERVRDLDDTLNEKYNQFMKKYSVFKEDFSDSDPIAKAYYEMLKKTRNG
jgi:DnaJ-class molecular chaperone